MVHGSFALLEIGSLFPPANLALLAAAFLAACVVGRLYWLPSAVPRSFTLLLAIALSWYLITAIVSPFQSSSALAFWWIVAGPSLFLATISIAGGKARTLLASIAFLCLFLSVFVISSVLLNSLWLEWLGRPPRSQGFHPSWKFGDLLAWLLVISSPALYPYIVPGNARSTAAAGSRPQSNLALVALAACGGATALAGCRVALVAFTVCLALAFCLGLLRSRLAVIAISLTLLLGLLVGFPLSSRRNAAITFEGRLSLWRAAAWSAEQSPLFGNGPNTFGLVFPDVYDAYYSPATGRRPLGIGHREEHAANEVLEIATESGIIGAALAISVFAAWFRLAWHRRNQLAAKLALCAIVAVACLALAEAPFRSLPSWALTWIWMAVPFLDVPGLSSQRFTPRD